MLTLRFTNCVVGLPFSPQIPSTGHFGIQTSLSSSAGRKVRNHRQAEGHTLRKALDGLTLEGPQGHDTWHNTRRGSAFAVLQPGFDGFAIIYQDYSVPKLL